MGDIWPEEMGELFPGGGISKDEFGEVIRMCLKGAEEVILESHS